MCFYGDQQLSGEAVLASALHAVIQCFDYSAFTLSRQNSKLLPDSEALQANYGSRYHNINRAVRQFVTFPI